MLCFVFVCVFYFFKIYTTTLQNKQTILHKTVYCIYIYKMVEVFCVREFTFIKNCSTHYYYYIQTLLYTHTFLKNFQSILAISSIHLFFDKLRFRPFSHASFLPSLTSQLCGWRLRDAQANGSSGAAAPSRWKRARHRLIHSILRHF